MPDAASRPQPKILILSNENPKWAPKDLDFSRQILATLLAALSERYTCELYVFFDDLSGLERYAPEEWLVWNWGEELGGRPWTDAEVTDELDRRGFAYTGSPGEVLRRTVNRADIKRRLQAAGLPTLPARVFTEPPEAGEWTLYPAIVKGNNQHASFGIGRDSIVTNAAELSGRIQYIRARFADDALVEPFLDSREFHVAVWGNDPPQALPPEELDYSVFKDMRDRLYTFEAKFDDLSVPFRDIIPVCPAPLDRPDWRARLEAVAVGAYQAIGLRDFGRFDLRMLGDEPQILDVNSNPDSHDWSVLANTTLAAGFSYPETVSQIVSFAAERWLPIHSARRSA